MIHIDHAAIDIKIYNVVQTGPNTQLGGLKLGRIICEYQGSLKADVIKPPIADAVKVIISIKTIRSSIMIIKVGDVVEVRRSGALRDGKIDNIQINCTDDYEASVMQVDTNKISEGTITYEDITFENGQGNMHWAYFNQIKC